MDRTKQQIRTPISYYGGKQALLSHTLPLFPSHIVYTETFFGGGSEFWAKVPAPNETINDKLDIVINFYQILKTRFRDLKKLIDTSLISRTMHRQAQYIITNKKFADPVHLAWAFWLCSNFSFSNKIGGGIKFSNRCDTVPPVTIKRKKAEFTELLVSRIENAHIECNDALIILNSRNIPEAFHRLDPPYMNADQGHYAGYTMEDYTKLLKWCAEDCTGKFLLSNYNSDILTEFISVHGWKKKEITVRLQAKGTNMKLKNKTEVLVWNYDETEGQIKMF